MVTIKPEPLTGTYRTARLTGLTKEDIVKALGFEPNAEDDPDKVVNSWSFTIDGNACAIWDYKGSHLLNIWSAFDPFGKLYSIFDADNIQDESK